MSTVSVIIPTYNSASTLPRAIDSVLAQRYPDVEVLVIDDGSTDCTSRKLEAYHDRIRTIYQENQGRSAARNRGIAEARGRYIAFLDADDWWDPDYLSAQVAALENNPDVGFVFNMHHVIEPDGTYQEIERADIYADSGSWMFPRMILREISAGSPSFVVVRREALDAVGHFNEAYHGSEDWDLWVRLSARYQVACVSTPHVYYQIHSGSQIERILSRNVQADWYSIIDGVFEDSAVAKRYGHLYQPARARVMMWDGLLDCAHGREQRATDTFAQMAKVDPDLLTPPAEPFVQTAIYIANLYQDSLDSAEKATKLIDSAWAQLPAEARNALRAQRQRAKGMLCAERFFANCKAGNWELVRKFGLETVRHQPSWLRNLGFVSIWTRATLRPVYPALAEDWHRQKFATNH